MTNDPNSKLWGQEPRDGDDWWDSVGKDMWRWEQELQEEAEALACRDTNDSGRDDR